MFFSRSYTAVSSVCILVVGNTPYGKRHTFRTKPVLVQAKYLRWKHTSTPIFFVQMSDQFRAFFNPKNASENNDKISLRHLLVNLKNVRVLVPPMFFSIELWRQWQPLVFPTIQASDGALRSIKHERCNSYSGEGPQNDQNSGIALRDANRRQACFWLIFTGSTIRLGWTQALI